jgi:hypothetical protein
MPCPTCNGTHLVLVREPDRRSRVGYTQTAKPCPDCRPLAYKLIEPDKKMQAAGDSE